MKREASATWTGDLKQGKGSFKTQSGALKDIPFSFVTRFEDQPGTNPEELIAAALASCYSMALSAALSSRGQEVIQIITQASVSFEQVQGQWTINGVHLDVNASLPNMDPREFQVIARETKENCPVSRALNVPITLQALFV
jgi:osmotically inducible protein OsmC